MAKDTFEQWGEEHEWGVEKPVQLADGIYGTSERVKAALERIGDWKMQSWDLDIAFGHL